MKQVVNFDQMTYEQQLDYEKTKKKIKDNVYKYFRNISLNEIKKSFNVWKDKVQLEQQIEKKYRQGRKRLIQKNTYYKQLEMEKDKQQSKLLISNFPSLHVGGGGVEYHLELMKLQKTKAKQKEKISYKDLHQQEYSEIAPTEFMA